MLDALLIFHRGHLLQGFLLGNPESFSYLLIFNHIKNFITED